MLRDPELHEAHEALKNLDPTHGGWPQLITDVNEMVSTTMTVLRVLDHLQSTVNDNTALVTDELRRLNDGLAHLENRMLSR